MPFEHAVFISYRHSDYIFGQRFVDDLRNALAEELDLYIRLPENVYQDRDKLRGGDFFNPKLARAICQSVCMIMVYTPIYFDYNSTYCAGEYIAMKQLEMRRMQLVNDSSEGFIIPVIMRGMEILPREIKANRQYYDFSGYSLKDSRSRRSRMITDSQYANTIQNIVSIVVQRYRKLKPHEAGLTNACIQDEDVKRIMPSQASIQDWLLQSIETLLPEPIMPGRTA